MEEALAGCYVFAVITREGRQLVGQAKVPDGMGPKVVLDLVSDSDPPEPGWRRSLLSHSLSHGTLSFGFIDRKGEDGVDRPQA